MRFGGRMTVALLTAKSRSVGSYDRLTDPDQRYHWQGLIHPAP